MALGTAEEGRAILDTQDDYIRALAPLERRLRLYSEAPVDTAAFQKDQAGRLRDWPAEATPYLTPLLQRLQQFLGGVAGRWPARLLLVRTDGELEDGAPFTRGAAMFVPDRELVPPGKAAFVLGHEAFHILTRHDPELRERLFAAIGFRACARTDVPEAVAALRVSNPDAPESRHTLRVRFRGEEVDALPYIRLPEDVKTRAGFMAQIRVRWLIADRAGDACVIRRAGPGAVEADPDELDGLAEQVGRNTRYFFHPEEILADNFALLFLEHLRGTPSRAPSPEVLERLRQILRKN